MRAIAIALIVCVTLAGCSERSKIKSEAETAVKALLRDPESARFDYGPPGSEFVFPDQGLVCGRVNSRNAYGGYAGFEMFAYQRGTGAYIASGDIGQFDVINDRCLRALRDGTAQMRAELNQVADGNAMVENEFDPLVDNLL